jgi:hypothetical protein
MSSYSRRLACGAVCLAAFLAALWVASGPVVHGQDKKASKKSGKPERIKPQANTKGLDAQADKLQSTFSRDAEDLAGQYYKAGHLEKAKALLESVLAVNPQSETAQKKLDLIKEGILNSNDVEVDVNASHGWEPSGVTVIENRALRIRAEGTYRFEAAAGGVPPAGFPDKDPGKDMIAGIPCGALMGMIVNETKPGKPFLIGESLDITPKDGGMLLLRINSPPGNKNSGKIKVSVSGYVQPSK